VTLLTTYDSNHYFFYLKLNIEILKRVMVHYFYQFSYISLYRIYLVVVEAAVCKRLSKCGLYMKKSITVIISLVRQALTNKGGNIPTKKQTVTDIIFLFL
jgi:hypothetical protein